MSRFIAYVGVFLLSSCALFTEPSITVRLRAAKELNHSKAYRSLPVAIRLYQLDEVDAFKHSDFDDFIDIQNPIVSLEEKQLTLAPNEKKTIRWRLNKETQYIAAIAYFRHKKNNWRDYIKLPDFLPKNIFSIDIDLQSEALRIKK